MGMYDEFVSEDGKVRVQLKVGACMYEYKVGDSVDDGVDYLDDGVYYGWEGVVVIYQRKVWSVSETMPEKLPAELPHRTKWGQPCKPGTDLRAFGFFPKLDEEKT